LLLACKGPATGIDHRESCQRSQGEAIGLL
jgi:hypothetical protein